MCRRFRAAHRMCRTATLRLRFDDFTRATRGHTLPQPTPETDAVLSAARTLLTAAGDLAADRGLSLLGVAVGDLYDDRAVQLSLPLDHFAPAAVDEVRDRFGSAALTGGVLLGRDEGLTVPLLPD